MEDKYLTINSIGKGYYTDRRSKFYAFAHHVETVDDCKALINEYRKKYFDARHCCYAYMLGPERQEWRANDDGEPSSTGGKPIMGQINSHELTDILVCVIRYYGGVNLGTSGLIEAYRTAAASAIEDADIIECFQKEEVKFHFTYPMMNGVMRIVKEMNPAIVSQSFDNDCDITLSIRASQAELLKSKLEKLAFE
ncbi:MAG: YigZ family protein [Prevotellaceae bacterium]|nr:YigZ family protein [Prevotellaceae bacterium]MBF1061471.1 YigZ family protein [Prevotellaceae bacterium]MBF1074320.1 YigZ family protein [Prevotellaceae bacterium]